MIRMAKKAWSGIAASIAAGLSYIYVKPTLWGEVALELVTFFSIQAIMVVPVMVFAAGIIGSKGNVLSEVEKLHKALETQMHFWLILLACNLLAILLLVIGQMVGWNEAINVCFSFFATLSIVRTIVAAKGLLSLLTLNSNLAKEAIRQRNKEKAREFEKNMSKNPYRRPKDFGEIVEEPDS